MIEGQQPNFAASLGRCGEAMTPDMMTAGMFGIGIISARCRGATRGYIHRLD
jgi:hypothetical protein